MSGKKDKTMTKSISANEYNRTAGDAPRVIPYIPKRSCGMLDDNRAFPFCPHCQSRKWSINADRETWTCGSCGGKYYRTNPARQKEVWTEQELKDERTRQYDNDIKPENSTMGFYKYTGGLDMMDAGAGE